MPEIEAGIRCIQITGQCSQLVGNYTNHLDKQGIKMFNPIKSPIVFSAIAFLVGCGGGGGDAPPPAVTTFPVQSALTYAYTNGIRSTLNVTGMATDGTVTAPITGSLTITLSPATSTTFNGAAALQTTETLNGMLTIGGFSEPLNSLGTAYLNLSYSPMAFSTDGSYCEATAPVVYPVTATAGQSGDLGNFNCYTDNTKTIFVGTEKETYITTAGSTFNTLDVKLITNVYDTSNTLIVSGGITYTITSGGIPSISEFDTQATENGITISITAK